MFSEAGVAIDAPVDTVWRVFSDVERWPEWTASVIRVAALDGPGIAVGKRFQLKQPRLPELVWEVTEVSPGASWSWAQRSPGGLTVAGHEVVAESGDRAAVRQWIDQRGPIGALVGLMMRRMTRRYLEMEAHGLKARCEGVRHRDGSAS